MGLVRGGASALSVKVYKNGAFQDVEALRRYENGAWKDCEAAYKHENGAWIEVWRSMGVFSLIALPRYGNGYVPSDNKSMSLMNGDGDKNIALTNSGYLDLRIEGEWVNPRIVFDWHGGLTYWNSSFTTGYRKRAGTIAIQAWPDTAGFSGYVELGRITIGSDKAWIGSIEDEYGSFDQTVNSAKYDVYKLIRVIITPVNETVAHYGAFNSIAIDKFLIDGKQVGFPSELNDFYKEYN